MRGLHGTACLRSNRMVLADGHAQDDTKEETKEEREKKEEIKNRNQAYLKCYVAMLELMSAICYDRHVYPSSRYTHHTLRTG